MTYYIAMGIGVAVSLAFVFVRSGGNSVRNLIFKSVSSLFFMLSAVFAVIENYTNAAQYGSLIIMGGALGLVGDILLDLKGVAIGQEGAASVVFSTTFSFTNSPVDL